MQRQQCPSPLDSALVACSRAQHPLPQSAWPEHLRAAFPSSVGSRQVFSSQECGTGLEAPPHLPASLTSKELLTVVTFILFWVPSYQWKNNVYQKETSKRSQGAAARGCLLLWLQTRHFADQYSACLFLSSQGNTLLYGRLLEAGASQREARRTA